MNVQTERGIICVEASYQSAERAQMDGYTYSFTAHNVYMPDMDATLNSVDFYGKALDDRGLRHVFAAVVGY